MMGIINRIKQKIKYELGITQLEQENQSLYFLLNNSIDITHIPPTRDSDLRLLQQCDTMLLAIFDKLCKKHGLNYWIDYGTLLGAVRHKSFIPWDDDIDISMLRSDMNQVMPKMKKEIDEMGLTIRYSHIHPLRCLVLAYKEEETGCWLDIFPQDEIVTTEDTDAIRKIVLQYRKYFDKNRKLDTSSLTNYKKALIETLPKGKLKYIVPAFETWKGNKHTAIYTEDYIFPLAKAQFDGFEFSMPGKANQVLTMCFGKNYMKFPHMAINDHGGGLPSSQRARLSKTNMCEVYTKLQEIYKKTN